VAAADGGNKLKDEVLERLQRWQADAHRQTNPRPRG
jgi:hypothetical protein